MTTEHFPFVAVVGHNLAKRALLLLAIEPRLGGMLIAARPGTAKTTLARSFHALLPTIVANQGCLSHCDPARPASWCSDCRQNFAVAKPSIVDITSPFVDLPLNVTEDRLLGGLSLEATLKSGKRVAERGLLAEANRGILYCDEINLLEDGPGNFLLDALGRGRLALEREGLSADYPTEFVLVGTFNPDEGEVRGGLADRVGLVISLAATDKTEERAEIMQRALAWSKYPATLAQEFQDETEILRQLDNRGA